MEETMDKDAATVTSSGEGGGKRGGEEAVKQPRENDVLCGRGGSINSHPGNERFRNLVEKRRRVYLTARFKQEKRLIAESIVSDIRNQEPPGRFLQRDAATGLWSDIGDEKAHDKTLQALRENAPSIRAELETKINRERAAAAAAAAKNEPKEEKAAPPPATVPSSGWGFPGFFGGAPPPPPPSHGYYPPPPPAHHHGHPPLHPPPPPGYYYPPPPADPYAHYPPPPHPPAPPAEKSALEQTADFVSSGAESLKNWIGSGVHSVNSADMGSLNSVSHLSYKREDETNKKRRVVKFSDDSYYKKKQQERPWTTSSVQSMEYNSVMDGSMQDDIEPETNLEAATSPQNSSVMKQVATQILGSFGSWDAASVICGADSTLNEKPLFSPMMRSSSSSKTAAGRGGEAVSEEDDMAVEWEGQEVQLVENNNNTGSNDADRRMPPPPPKSQDYNSVGLSSMGNNSIAFSSLGSCHSWLPDSVLGDNSYNVPSTTRSDDHQSMEMEQQSAAGTENFSMGGGSIGGGSLTQVFEHDSAARRTTAT